VLLKGNEPGKARQAAQDAVNLDENSAAAHIKLGEVLLELEKYEEAVQEYKVNVDACRAGARIHVILCT
jgi:predicted Zn-dependent protease